MKISRKHCNRLVVPKREPLLFIMDEFHMMTPSPELSFGRLQKPPGRQIVAIQAFYTGKGGKQKTIGWLAYQDTGERVKPLPKKFYPAQVHRRKPTAATQ
jgi:hypothetical protein